jgi:hypothetical protein
LKDPNNARISDSYDAYFHTYLVITAVIKVNVWGIAAGSERARYFIVSGISVIPPSGLDLILRAG